MKKKLQIEVNFPDNFMPPEKFHDPEQDKDFNTPCDLCPFFIYDDIFGYACLLVDGDSNEQACPIKEQFHN